MSLALAGAALTAGSTIFSGIAASNAANYQSQVAENQARIDAQKAQYALEAGGIKQQQQALKSAEQQGQIVAALGANNVDVNTGSAKEVRAGQREAGLLDQYTIAGNAANQAWGYRVEGQAAQAQAGLESSEATSDLIGGGLKAGGGLLSSANSTGLSNLFTKWTGGTGGGGAATANPWSLDTATAAG
jgi:hypothetical protein